MLAACGLLPQARLSPDAFASTQGPLVPGSLGWVSEKP